MELTTKISKNKLVFLLFFFAALLAMPGLALAQTHTVNKGDSIYKIAAAYNVSQDALRSANNLWTDSIYPGQKLTIPQKYTVQKGDTLPPGNYITASRGSFSRSDFDVLARIITAEADSESYATQVAVGAVVLNRLDSPLFPKTIRGVVYQVDAGGKYQFSPVLNGWINHPASETGQKAAMDALNGWDPTNGALYFWESWVTNPFLTSRPVAVNLGAFTFTY